MSEAVEASIHSVSHSSASQPEKVEINAYGVAISDNAGKIGSKIGKLVRIHVPISYESWDKVPGKCKDDVWDELQVSLLLCGLTFSSFYFYFVYDQLIVCEYEMAPLEKYIFAWCTLHHSFHSMVHYLSLSQLY